jgi:hypothetical protein
VSGAVKILAALVNPVGADPGSEAITLINMGSTTMPLAGWRLIDKMDKHYEIPDLTQGTSIP